MAGNQGNSRKRPRITCTMRKIQNPAGQERVREKSSRAKSDNVCPYAKKCGGCDYQGVEYKEQLKTKQAYMKKLLKPFCFVEPIVGMKIRSIIVTRFMQPLTVRGAVRLWREPTGKTHMMWWISKAA